MNKRQLDLEYLKTTLVKLLNIHSPSGFSDQVVHFVGKTLDSFGVHFEVTRRGTIRATMPGKRKIFDRAIAVHLDTLGAMVSRLKQNGRLEISPIGTWSSRFAEGARVTIFSENDPLRGTVLPLKASGHTYNDEIDTQPVAWNQVEVRVDARCASETDIGNIGINIGDFVAFDATPEVLENGFINARHLDDKAGVALLLTVIREISRKKTRLPVECHFFHHF